MRRRKFSIWFMLLVSILMLSVEVIPHHHHNGVPCFHMTSAEQPAPDTDKEDSRACQCLADFCAAETGGHTHHESYCNHFPSAILLEDMLFFCLLIPEQTLFTYIPVFIESLHATVVSCSSGLRAPPVFA